MRNSIEEITNYIWDEIINKKLGQENTPKNNNKTDKQKDVNLDKLKRIINQPPSAKNNEQWEQEKSKLEEQIQDLRKQNKDKDLENGTLKEIIQALKKKIKELETEIQDLKQENDPSPEAQAYLQKKEAELQDKKDKLKIMTQVKVKNDVPATSSVAPTLGIVAMAICFLGVLIFISQKRTKDSK